MAELDFDELDKAVNDLMANVDTTKRPAGLDDPEDKVVTIAPSEATEPVAGDDGASSQGTAPVKTDVPAPASIPTSTSASLAVKRRGQFMDIVHPSSDMTSTNRPASRQGVTIQPVKDADIATTPAPSDTSTAVEPSVPAPEVSNTPPEEPIYYIGNRVA